MSDMPYRLKADLVPFGHGCHEIVDPLPGLYAFWLRGTCLYVGMSENLRRRIAQHEVDESNLDLNDYFCKFPDEIEMSIASTDSDTCILRALESECIATLRPVTNAKVGGATL